jgi:uncharacterized protein (DUF885 family)
LRRKLLALAVLILGLTLLAPAQPTGQGSPPQRPGGPPPAQQPEVPPADLRPLLLAKQSEMTLVINRYKADRNQLGQFYHCMSPTRFARLKRFDLDWAAALTGIKATSLSASARKDLKMLTETIQTDLKQIEADAAAVAQIESLVPFAAMIVRLEEARMRLESMDAEQSALILSQASEFVAGTRTALEAALGSGSLNALAPGKDIVVRAADNTKALRATLKQWFGFYNDYDPLFTWWMAQPYKEADKLLEDYAAFLREKIAPAVQPEDAPLPTPVTVEAAPAPGYAEVPDLGRLLSYPQDEMRGVMDRFRGRRDRGFGGMGGSSSSNASVDEKYLKAWLTALKKLNFNRLSRAGQVDYLYLRESIEVRLRRAAQPPLPAPRQKADSSGIKGNPIGREALMLNLAEELIPYTPEELIAAAERQFAWCETEMKKASAEAGFGDDWKAAVEKVKGMHAAPGRQPDVVRDLMRGAVDYLRVRDLITVPEIESETLRMEMMSARQQLVNPFFTGGTVISVSFPTSAMTTRQKLESLRGNNIPFSHATAFHEMIPGHNMQFYMSRRFGSLEANPSTSFWLEGWAVYWETLLYDLGFDETPEERIGALFWRMHRCARIVFSLKYHLGEWSPQECVDYLVEKVGHERENATAEVRRSFEGGYGPLYQASYLVGALQMRALKAELVDSGRMTIKAFHDAVIERGSLPIALLRLWLDGGKLRADMPLEWRFLETGADQGE